jgi:hypothetical protein
MRNTSKVSELIAETALASVSIHPLHSEAASCGYFTSDVFMLPKNVVDRVRIPDEQRRSLHQALDRVSTVLVVAYWTAVDKPVPAPGFGKLYSFFLHPDTFAVLQADIDTWQS